MNLYHARPRRETTVPHGVPRNKTQPNTSGCSVKGDMRTSMTLLTKTDDIGKHSIQKPSTDLNSTSVKPERDICLRNLQIAHVFARMSYVPPTSELMPSVN